MKTSKTTHLGVVACATSILCLGSSAAFAGEITGNGKDLKPLKGKSACAFSGRQDNYEDDEGVFKNMLVQSWGQATPEMKEFFIAIGLHPGLACNPTRAGQ